MTDLFAMELAAGAAVIYILVAGIILALKHRQRMKILFLREFLKLMLFFYFFMLISLTLNPSFGMRNADGVHRVNINLIPLATISNYFIHLLDGLVSHSIFVRDFFGNIVAFVPLGLLAPAVWPRYRKLWECLLLGMLCSAGIEIAQLAFSYVDVMARMTDIDDVILNTLGTIVGFGLFKLGRGFVFRVQSSNISTH
jgi:glycopeptide antibiotics resistance protein